MDDRLELQGLEVSGDLGERSVRKRGGGPPAAGRYAGEARLVEKFRNAPIPEGFKFAAP
jgi:hypothetical protein